MSGLCLLLLCFCMVYAYRPIERSNCLACAVTFGQPLPPLAQDEDVFWTQWKHSRGFQHAKKLPGISLQPWAFTCILSKPCEKETTTDQTPQALKEMLSVG